MKRYSILEIKGDEEFDAFNTSYHEVKELAINTTSAEELTDLLMYFISNLNNEYMSSANWFYLVDNNEGIILQFKS